VVAVSFFIVFFNENTQQALYIIAIYKPPQMNANFFISVLENIITKIPTNYPTIIIGDFNINMLTNTIESITLQNYINTHGFHITFIASTTPNNTQIDHIWTNAPTQQCHSESTQAYWKYHDPIYLKFKLPNHISHHVLMNLLRTKNRFQSELDYKNF
jgi:endonuclease/exonuclease/phosphatase family metal-dependent hydrolase